MLKFYLAFCILFGLSSLVHAQQNGKLLDVDFKQAGIGEVVNELKAKTGYRFYYDPAQFDSLKVTFAIRQKPLEFILDKAFEHTPYHYAVTAKQEVILTKTLQINTNLVPGFFDNGSTQATAAVEVPFTDYSIDEKKKVAEATTENKLYEIGIRTNNIKSGTANLAGYVKNAKSGEGIIGASVYNPDSHVGIATDQFGYFSLTLPRGRQTLVIKGLGMKDTRRRIILYSDGKLNIDMQEQVTSLKEVTISAEKVANVRSVEMGVNKLDIKSIKQIPTAFGEADVLRVVLTLPGVQSVGEATTGFNVR
ncbi:MAG TPA: carboxypeptidase-like regulatory domain-containing protein, partial [Mucilaginibacter sp.]